MAKWIFFLHFSVLHMFCMKIFKIIFPQLLMLTPRTRTSIVLPLHGKFFNFQVLLFMLIDIKNISWFQLNLQKGSPFIQRVISKTHFFGLENRGQLNKGSGYGPGFMVQSNLDYQDLDYLDYLIIPAFFSGPVFHEY